MTEILGELDGEFPLFLQFFSGNNVNENERRRGVSINSPLAREHFERRRLAWRDSDEARAVISHRVGVLKENKDGGRVITVPQLNEH